MVRRFGVLAAVMATLVLIPGTASGGVDGDSDADIVFTNLEGQRNRVCIGDGTGGFACTDVSTDTNSNADVGLGDVDGDGDLDAVFANYGRNRVCIGDGTGGFACSDISTDSNTTDGVSLGDVDGDGDLDAVFANFGVNVTGERNKVCLGDGSGGFTCSDVNTDSNASADVRLGDVNGDGDLDAVFANLGEDVTGRQNRVCLGDGSGAFTCSDVSGDTNTSSDVALGDLNGDSNLDAVFVNNVGRERVCLGDGSGGFTCGDLSTDDVGIGGVGIGDVDGDDDLDVLVVGGVGRNKVCLGDGSGSFTCGDISTDPGGVNVAVGDVDRDGNLDAAIARIGQSNLVCLGDGSGGFICSNVSADANDTHGVGLAPGKRGSFFDDDSSIFEADIEWLAGEGITGGCNPPTNDMYCPNDSVTRGQMATFLVRALGLTPSDDDGPFTDHLNSVHRRNINALRISGITSGCAVDRFCPNDSVKRAQMATFLVNALGLTPSDDDGPFTDHLGSVHRRNINALRISGITSGCAADKYCPAAFVKRGQMAAFLHRAFG